MRRASILAMLVALAVWLTPASACAFCAAAGQSHAMSCCTQAQAKLPAMCCSGGTAVALDSTRGADTIAKAGAADLPLFGWAAAQASDGRPVGVLRGRLLRRTKPPIVLRT